MSEMKGTLLWFVLKETEKKVVVRAEGDGEERGEQQHINTQQRVQLQMVLSDQDKKLG